MLIDQGLGLNWGALCDAWALSSCLCSPLPSWQKKEGPKCEREASTEDANPESYVRINSRTDIV